jgi:AcrR family transcriptional regulator
MKPSDPPPPAGLRQKLVDAATLALDAGAGEPSLRALARDLGVSAMASYRHFPDKAALMAAVVEQGFVRLSATLAAADASAPGMQALVAQGLAYVDFAMAHPGLFRLMFGPAGQADNAAAARARAYNRLSARVAALQPGNPAAATLACWAVVHGLAVLQLDHALATSREELREALAVAIRGLGVEHHAANPPETRG